MVLLNNDMVNKDFSFAVFGPWSAFSACSASCGGGTQIRSRNCVSGRCQGPFLDERDCNTQICPG